MVHLLNTLVSRFRPDSSSITTVLPIVPSPTTLEVIIYCGFKLDRLLVHSSHDVSTTPFNQSGTRAVRANVERELLRFYRAYKNGNIDKLRYRIAFVCVESIENAELFAVDCEQLACELALQHDLVVRTAITFSRR